jgi:hypothetical protein
METLLIFRSHSSTYPLQGRVFVCCGRELVVAVALEFPVGFAPPVIPIRDPVDVVSEVEADEGDDDEDPFVVLEAPPTIVAPTTLVSKVLPSR